MAEHSDIANHWAIDQSIGIVAISLLCCFFLTWYLVLPVSLLLVLATLRRPALAVPMYSVLGTAAIVSQIYGAFHGDVVSAVSIVILIPLLIFLCYLVLFDKNQKVIGTLNTQLSKCGQQLYLTTARVRILLAIALVIVMLRMLTWESSTMLYGFTFSWVPLCIYVFVGGVKMLRECRTGAPDRA